MKCLLALNTAQYEGTKIRIIILAGVLKAKQANFVAIWVKRGQKVSFFAHDKLEKQTVSKRKGKEK